MKRITLQSILLLLFIVFSSMSQKEHFKLSQKCLSYNEKLAQEFVSKYNMKLINTGTLFFNNPNYKLWGMALMDSRQLTVEQARPLMYEMVFTYLKMVNQHEFFQTYLNNASYYLRNEPLYKVIALKVAFWDQNVNRPPQPYVADMRYEDGNITYYVTNPKDQSLLPFLTESYEEAQKKLLGDHP